MQLEEKMIKRLAVLTVSRARIDTPTRNVQSSLAKVFNCSNKIPTIFSRFCPNKT